MATVIEVTLDGSVHDPKFTGLLNHVTKYKGMTPAYALAKYNKMYGSRYKRVFAAGPNYYEDVTSWAMMPTWKCGTCPVLLVTPHEERLLAFRRHALPYSEVEVKEPPEIGPYPRPYLR